MTQNKAKIKKNPGAPPLDPIVGARSLATLAQGLRPIQAEKPASAGNKTFCRTLTQRFQKGANIFFWFYFRRNEHLFSCV